MLGRQSVVGWRVLLWEHQVTLDARVSVTARLGRHLDTRVPLVVMVNLGRLILEPQKYALLIHVTYIRLLFDIMSNL